MKLLFIVERITNRKLVISERNCKINYLPRCPPFGKELTGWVNNFILHLPEDYRANILLKDYTSVK